MDYSKVSYPTLVRIAKLKKLLYIPTSRLGLVNRLTEHYNKHNRIRKSNFITPDKVKSYNIIDNHACTCDKGEHKDIHKSETVEIILQDGKKREVRICENDIGISIAKSIDDIKLWNNVNSKRKSYIKMSVVWPIQHFLATEIYSE